MSDDEGTISADGVTVEKSLDRERFNTPAVVFEIRSTRDTSVTVRLTDHVPEEIPIDDVGFHPEYGGDSWSLEDHSITFERTFEPDEEAYETIYGVRDVDEADIEALLEVTPSLDVGPVAEGADEAEDEPVDVEDVVGEGDDVVREVITGESDSLPGAEAEAAETSPDEPEGAEATDDATAEDTADVDAEAARAAEIESDDAEEAVDASEESAETGGATAGPATPSPDHDGLAAALAAELRAGEVAEADERTLRDALGVAEGTGAATGSLRARVEHLQTEVSELAAYTGELETFLDEHGGGDSVLGALQDDLSEVSEDVADLEERTADLDDVEGRMDDLDAVEDTVAELDGDVTELEGTLADARDDIEGLRVDVDAATESVDALDARLDGVELDVEDLLYLEEEIEELREDMGRIDDLDDRLASVEDAVGDLESDMDEMKTFRDRLSSAFGPDEG